MEESVYYETAQDYQEICIHKCKKWSTRQT